MNEKIISNWNELVSQKDTVYHLGDFCSGKKEEDFNKIFGRLNGSIIFIKGNHDKLAWKMKHKFAAFYSGYHEIKIDNQEITLCHYKMSIWPKKHYKTFHLYGHSHGTASNPVDSLSFDVGVDCHEFKPISFERVKEIMSQKIFSPNMAG